MKQLTGFLNKVPVYIDIKKASDIYIRDLLFLSRSSQFQFISNIKQKERNRIVKAVESLAIIPCEHNEGSFVTIDNLVKLICQPASKN